MLFSDRASALIRSSHARGLFLIATVILAGCVGTTSDLGWLTTTLDGG